MVDEKAVQKAVASIITAIREGPRQERAGRHAQTRGGNV